MDLGFWKFDDGDARDYSRFGNNGTLTGVLFDSPPIFPGGESSARFTGASNISVPHSEYLNPFDESFYVEFFIKRQNTSFTIVNKGCYGVEYINELIFSVLSESGGSASVSSGVEIDTEPHHIIVSYSNSGNVSFYVDGVLESVDSLQPTKKLASTLPLAIGTNFVGTLDDLRIATGVVGEVEASARYSQLSLQGNYEWLVNYTKPYSFTPLGEELGDSTYQGRDLVWSVEPPQDKKLIYGLPDSSLIGSETATLTAPDRPLSVSVWTEFQPSLAIFSYGAVSLTTSADRILVNNGGVVLQSAIIPSGELVFISVGVSSTTLSLYVNQVFQSANSTVAAAASLGFFGGAPSLFAGLEVSDSLLPESKLDKRFRLGFSGTTRLPLDSGEAFSSIAETNKILNFNWVNYAVKR